MTSGASGLILDGKILDGNPADSTLAVEMIERLRDSYGEVPRQATFDGAFCSKDNLETLKSIGGSNKVIVRKQDPSHVLRFERPALRIIEPELWRAVQERQAAIRRKYTGKRKAKGDGPFIAGNKSSYLLTGLLTCGVCGGHMGIRSGRRWRYYRCEANRKKGICENKRSIREDKLRPAILEAIRERLMDGDGIAYVRKRIAAELGEVSRRLESKLDEYRARREHEQTICWKTRLV